MGEVLCSTENSPFLIIDHIHAKINRVCCAALAIGKRCMNVKKNKLLHFDTKFVKMLDLPFVGYSMAIFFTMFSAKAKTVSICLSKSQTLSRYQKNIGKMINNRSKMRQGIWSL